MNEERCGKNYRHQPHPWTGNVRLGNAPAPKFWCDGRAKDFGGPSFRDGS